MFLSKNQRHCFCLGHSALNYWIHISPRNNGEESYRSHTGTLTLRLTGKLKPFSCGFWNGFWAGGAEQRPGSATATVNLPAVPSSSPKPVLCRGFVHSSLEMEAPCFSSHTLFIKWAFVRLIVKINAAQWSTSSLTLHLMGKFQNWTTN